MKFIDHTQISAKAGDGGRGMMSFLRARNKPHLGPDGGNGGPGGSVYVKGSSQLNTLSSLYYKQQYRAQPGGKGGSNNKTGAHGSDLEIMVPVGTVVKKRPTNESEVPFVVCGEVIEDGERILVAQGGKRGYGNLHFASATQRAPRHHSPGEPGEIWDIELELKILADIGLAGLPNAGKSTLLSVISAARPKIADYPFTTLVPQVGVVTTDYSDESFVVADIPGLIAGASQGKGLGHDFLRHLERTGVNLFVLDGCEFATTHAEDAFRLLHHEMQSFKNSLVDKPGLIAVNKLDAIENPEEVLAKLRSALPLPVMGISASTGLGLPELKEALWKLLEESRKAAEELEVSSTSSQEDSGESTADSLG